MLSFEFLSIHNQLLVIGCFILGGRLGRSKILGGHQNSWGGGAKLFFAVKSPFFGTKTSRRIRVFFTAEFGHFLGTNFFGGKIF